MITEADGFKRPEKGDPMGKGIMATYENTVILHDQIRELREAVDLLLQKMEKKQQNQ